jgi:tryptophan 2,3-dioxygenase
MTTCPFNPADDGAEMAFDRRMSYGDYLRMDRHPWRAALLTGAHDEMLFIIQHQTSELWMRLACTSWTPPAA